MNSGSLTVAAAAARAEHWWGTAALRVAKLLDSGANALRVLAGLFSVIKSLMPRSLRMSH